MSNIFFKTHRLTLLNFAVVLYFLMLYVVYIYKLQTVILWGIVELFTIPFFIAQLVLLVINVK